MHIARLLTPDKAFSVINCKSIIKTITNLYQLFFVVMTHIDEHIKHLFVSKATNVNKWIQNLSVPFKILSIRFLSTVNSTSFTTCLMFPAL